MNNQAEKFHQENSKMIQQLSESLEAILNKFEQGIIPGEPIKSDASYMLSTYLDALIEFKETKQEAFIKVSKTGKQKFDEKEARKELSGVKKCIYILLKLAREKMMLVDNALMDSVEGEMLLSKGYCEEIIAGTEDTHYYILGEKGEKAVRCKGLTASFRNDICTAVVPQGLINDSFKWTNLYVRRVEMINKYFRNMRADAEHIIFSLDDTKEMVFGCEIGDFEDVVYIFAGIFDEKIDAHIAQLKEIANSGKIDRLIIINSSVEGKKLLEGAGLAPAENPHIEFEVLK